MPTHRLRALAVPTSLVFVAGLMLAPVAVTAATAETPEFDHMQEFSAAEFAAEAAQLPAGLTEAIDRDLGLTPEEYLAQGAAASLAVEVVDGLEEAGVGVLGSRLDGTELIVNVESPTDATIVESTGAIAELGEPAPLWDPTGRSFEFAVDVYGGQGWIFWDGSSWYQCSTGFAGVTVPSGTPQIATAGHCTEDMVGNAYLLNQSAPDQQGTQGAMLGQEISSTTLVGEGRDVGRIGSGGQTLRPAIATWGWGAGAPQSSVRAVTGDTQTIAGAGICKSGSRTGWTCGTVAETDYMADVCVENCDEPGEIVKTVRSVVAQICVRNGDSGGTAVHGTRAVGITSWGTAGSTCTSDTYSGFFQMVSPGGFESVASQYGSTWELSATVSAPVISSISSSGGSDTAINGTVANPGTRYTVDVFIDGASTPFATAGVNPSSGAWSVNVSSVPQGIHAFSAVARYATKSVSSATTGFIKRGVAVDRIAGTDRFVTSATIAARFSGSDTVYLANGLKYPDALSAASAAGSKNAPLLLTAPTYLPLTVANALEGIDPNKVYILGGTDTISNSVVTEVTTLLPEAQITRIAGVDRFATSRDISRDAFSPPRTTAYIATGLNFPDALSAAAAAGDIGAPVILVNGGETTLDTATRTLLTTLGVTDVYVTGSPASVSQGIENAIEAMSGVNAERLAGPDRYATSVVINDHAFSVATEAYLAVGTGFADALSGAALAGRDGAPLFVVQPTCVPAPTLQAMSDMGVTTVHLLGAEASLSANVAKLVPC